MCSTTVVEQVSAAVKWPEVMACRPTSAVVQHLDESPGEGVDISRHIPYSPTY
jgi:hypothetical protein